MHSKIMFFFPTVLIVALLIAWFGLSKRKDISLQEVMPLDQGVAVVNPMKWYNDKLQISITLGNGNTTNQKYNDVGECIFQGLSNEKQYTVEIKRTDMKGMLLYKRQKVHVSPRSRGSRYIVLVGASIGKGWEFEKIGDRINLGKDYILGNRTVYQFDKGNEIRSLTELNTPVFAVIIKECSAYFPRDLSQSKALITSWVSQLEAKGIRPVLATVVPVTKVRDKKSPGKFNSILEYNDFIRSYATNKGILILDLEEALRIGESDRHLEEEYAQPDGSHLVKRAYDEVLDNVFLKMIQEINN